MSKSVKVIEGHSFSDERGTLNCINEFAFEGVRRFYQIKHYNTSVVRAWQGHKVEHKYFYVAEGSFLIVWVQIDDFDNPSPGLIAESIILSSENPAVLSVPAGYANGIKATAPNSILSVYSNLTLEQSEEDRWSYHHKLWFQWPE
jgi:dTDP-4-dehydrorhamnose 3,5-epimerase